MHVQHIYKSVFTQLTLKLAEDVWGISLKIMFTNSEICKKS